MRVVAAARKNKVVRFLSASRLPSVAFNYANVWYNQSKHTCRPVLLRLTQDTGRDIKRFSAFPDEEETMMGPSSFEVTGLPALDKLPPDVYGYLLQFNRLHVFTYIELRQVNP